MKNTHRVYGLINPLTDEIFYVGCTGKSIESRVRGAYVAPTVHALREQGLQPIAILLDECDSKDAKLMENYWMQQLRIWGVTLENRMVSAFPARYTPRVPLVTKIKKTPMTNEEIQSQARKLRKLNSLEFEIIVERYCGVYGFSRIINGGKVRNNEAAQLALECAQDVASGLLSTVPFTIWCYPEFRDYIVPSSINTAYHKSLAA